MSCMPVRASPQITGPWTSRAIASTASKSPGEVIGKPASMMSTPRRASWCAISSFSCLLSEIPGDCSPSRRVVSKIFTRSFSARSMSGSVPSSGLLARGCPIPVDGECRSRGADHCRPCRVKPRASVYRKRVMKTASQTDVDIKDSILDAIGDTPLVRLSRLGEGAHAAARRQGRGAQPGRLDQGPRRRSRLIEAAERDGKLQAGRHDHRADQRQHRHRPGDRGARSRATA